MVGYTKNYLKWKINYHISFWDTFAQDVVGNVKECWFVIKIFVGLYVVPGSGDDG